MTYQKKIYLCLLISISAFIPLVALSTFTIKKLVDDGASVLATNARESLLVERLQFYNASKARQFPAYLLSGDAQFIESFKEFHSLFNKTLDEIKRISPTGDLIFLNQIKNRSDEAYAMFPLVQKMFLSGMRPEAAQKFFHLNIQPITDHVDSGGKELAMALKIRVEKAEAEFEKTVKELKMAIGIMALLTVLSCALAVRLLLRVCEQKRISDADNARISLNRKEVVEVIAHDIKSPLATIQMMLDEMKDNLSSEDAKDDLRGGIDMIDRSTKAISVLTSDILDHAKIESGNLEVELASCSLSRLVADVVVRFTPLAKQKNILLDSNMDKEEIISCLDSGRIDQAISNLLSNAIKFTPERGCIKVSCHKVASEILVSVEDSGPGLSQEQMLHVFERYWQVRKSGQHGTGLGLSIVKSIVTAHKGKIWVQSELSHGSNFLISLPT